VRRHAAQEPDRKPSEPICRCPQLVPAEEGGEARKGASGRYEHLEGNGSDEETADNLGAFAERGFPIGQGMGVRRAFHLGQTLGHVPEQNVGHPAATPALEDERAEVVAAHVVEWVTQPRLRAQMDPLARQISEDLVKEFFLPSRTSRTL
jgi:hypothetical protein